MIIWYPLGFFQYWKDYGNFLIILWTIYVTTLIWYIYVWRSNFSIANRLFLSGILLPESLKYLCSSDIHNPLTRKGWAAVEGSGQHPHFCRKDKSEKEPWSDWGWPRCVQLYTFTGLSFGPFLCRCHSLWLALYISMTCAHVFTWSVITDGPVLSSSCWTLFLPHHSLTMSGQTSLISCPTCFLQVIRMRALF